MSVVWMFKLRSAGSRHTSGLCAHDDDKNIRFAGRLLDTETPTIVRQPTATTRRPSSLTQLSALELLFPAPLTNQFVLLSIFSVAGGRVGYAGSIMPSETWLAKSRRRRRRVVWRRRLGGDVRALRWVIFQPQRTDCCTCMRAYVSL